MIRFEGGDISLRHSRFFKNDTLSIDTSFVCCFLAIIPNTISIQSGGSELKGINRRKNQVKSEFFEYVS